MQKKSRLELGSTVRRQLSLPSLALTGFNAAVKRSESLRKQAELVSLPAGILKSPFSFTDVHSKAVWFKRRESAAAGDMALLNTS